MEKCELNKKTKLETNNNIVLLSNVINYSWNQQKHTYQWFINHSSLVSAN